MKKILPISLLILFLSLSLANVNTQKVTLPTFDDVMKWIEVGQWFYYEIYSVRYSGGTIVNATYLMNYTVTGKYSYGFSLKRVTHRVYQGKKVYISTDRFLVTKNSCDILTPVLLPKNITAGKLSSLEAGETKVNATFYIDYIDKTDTNITVKYRVRYVLYWEDQPEAFVIEVNSTTIITSIKPNLVLKSNMSSIAYFVNKTSHGLVILENTYRKEVTNSILKKTNVKLVEELEEITQKYGGDIASILFNWIILTITIAVASAIIMKKFLKRKTV